VTNVRPSYVSTVEGLVFRRHRSLTY